MEFGSGNHWSGLRGRLRRQTIVLVALLCTFPDPGAREDELVPPGLTALIDRQWHEYTSRTKPDTFGLGLAAKMVTGRLISLAEIMKAFNFDVFSNLLSLLGVLEGKLASELKSRELAGLCVLLEGVDVECVNLGLTASSQTIRRLRGLCETGGSELDQQFFSGSLENRFKLLF